MAEHRKTATGPAEGEDWGVLMGIMVSEVYEALVEAGASEVKAKAAAEAIPVIEQMATKQGLTEVQSALQTLITQAKADLEVSIAALEAKVWRAGIAIAALAVLLNRFFDWVIRQGP